VDDGGDVHVRGWLTLDKPWLEALSSTIHIDAFKKDHMEMQMGVDDTAKASDKRARSQMGFLPCNAVCDRLLVLHCSFVHRTREVLSVQHEKGDKECYGTEETLFWANGQRRFVYSALCPRDISTT
jgi:hypothetical protein